ncbi:MAG TPA: aspartate carbamoyltransferase catalytic subunit [Thermodesulfobacteriota bacterium]
MTAPRVRLRHLLGLRGLDAETLTGLLDAAVAFKEIASRPIKKVPALRGKTVVNLFFENSTRTRSSFEIAAKWLSADAINISASSSSVQKGETLLDTARTLEAMRPDVIVMRHPASGAPHMLAAMLRIAVVNAGDGANEHPSQGLLDALTIREKKGRIAGLKVAILGDIAHSRVARSNLYGLTTLGAEVHLAGPPTLLPPGLPALGARVHARPEPAIEGADVVMVLRLQLERMARSFVPSIREYSRFWGLDRKKLELAAPDALVMHPGPMNRGVEISSDVADGDASVVLDQVTNGVAVRMAILFALAGGGEAAA